MDSRSALQENTVLCFDGGTAFTVTAELSRGGSSIVYNGYYLDNLNERKTVRIKECYPFKCALSRAVDQSLIIPESEQTLFEREKERFCQAYRFGNTLFQTDGLTNLTANTYNLFFGGNTVYIISAYAQGRELSSTSYASPKDCIAVVKSVAGAICKIHRQGFLYLDIKPSNVFTLNGTTDFVQLFDFDSLVPIRRTATASNGAAQISFTKGFAAPEQQTGDYRLIGRRTDVYGIGALLFYLLFDRTPSFFDSEADAQYNYAKSKLNGTAYQDRLYRGLTDFFHNTLANYAPDRYPCMEAVIDKLSALAILAEPTARFIHSTRIADAGMCVGRETELKQISKLLSSGTACLFVCGMGGIGKSTLVRAWIAQNKQLFDSILFLDYSGTVEKTITDDFAVQINGVSRDAAETSADYFVRKLGVLRTLFADRKTLLVMDNYTGDESDALPRLILTGCQLIVITRTRALAGDFATLEIDRIFEEAALVAIFEKHIGHRLSPDETTCAASIIEKVRGHTLAVELLAKQIGNPLRRMSVADAAALCDRLGFSHIAAEKIDYQKDQATHRDTIGRIIADLFEANKLSKEQRVLLSTAALFGGKGVSVHQLCAILDIQNRDELGELFRNGWISVDQGVIRLHPVIAEAVSNWRLLEEMKCAAIKVISFLKDKLLVDGEEAENLYLPQAMAVLAEARKISALSESGAYEKLLYGVILKTPYEIEDYLLQRAEEYISLFKHGDADLLMEVYDRLLEILHDRGEMELAKHHLSVAGDIAQKSHDPHVRGRFYDLLVSWYDHLLHGAYDYETSEQEECYFRLLASIDCAIKQMKRSRHSNKHQLLGEYYRTKLLLLIRSGTAQSREIESTLHKMQKEIELCAAENPRLVRNCTMAMAWFFTYCEQNYEAAQACMKKAESITDSISRTDVEKIDEFSSPAANILAIWQRYAEAAARLNQCISVCRKHSEIAIYRRKEVELLAHLAQVYLYDEQYDSCRASLTELIGKAEQYGISNFEDYLDEELLEAIHTLKPSGTIQANDA